MALRNLPTPDTADLNNHFILGEIIKNVGRLEDQFPQIDFDELIDQATQVQSRKVDPEIQVRGVLKVFQKTPVFKDAFSKLDATTQSQIQGFLDGKSADEVVGLGGFSVPPSPAAKHHFSLLTLFQRFKTHGEALAHLEDNGLPIIYEDAARKKVMEVHSDTPFENWGQSVETRPRYTFVPTKVLGLQNLVLYAKENGLRVRSSGYRHSWSPIFSQDGEILISLLNLQQVTEIPDPSSIAPIPASNADNELKTIELAEASLANNPTKRLARVGVSVTNEEFRRWAIKHNAWALPMDVILVEVTIGGVNGPICHGAGRAHQTLSDQVRQIDYIDLNGKLQSISDPVLLKAAAGCFGLLGVVTHITFELEAMTYALTRPRKPDIGLAIPPLSPSDVPDALKKNWTPDQFSDALAKFEDSATNDYYSEWFWFPYQQTAWVNCWNNTSNADGVVEYPSPAGVWLQWIEGWIGGVMMASEFFAALPGRWQAQLLATFGMAVLPPLFPEEVPEIKTYLPDALHFRRGIQNSRVRDMEFQIPLPPLATDPKKPDFTIVRKAWWDVINLVYSAKDAECPMRLTLELRIMGGSQMLMAPQYGNSLGTASIEVLTTPDTVDDGEWKAFCQNVYEIWSSYDTSLNLRPHWAKEWVDLKMGGKPAKEYLREVAYKDRIEDFKGTLAKIGNMQGWKLGDLKKRFSNELWDEMIYPDQAAMNGATNGIEKYA